MKLLTKLPTFPRRRRLLLALPALACMRLGAQPAWPSKPIRVVVPFAAGGPADTLARFLAPRMAAELGQPLLIDNKGGAGGTLGAADVARAPADGHTLLFSSTGALVIFPALSNSLPYDAERDLVAVGHAVTTPMVFVTSAQGPYKNMAALLRAAKARPGALNYASAGSGTTTQLGLELLKREAGVFMTHIPYRGAAPAITDLIAGAADVMLADLPAVLPFIKADRMRGLGLAWPRRAAELPEVPTTAELGLKGVVSSTWYGLMAPAKTPAETIQRVNAALNKALQQPDTVAFMKAQGVQAIGGTAAEFAAFVRAEATKLGSLARAVGVKLD